MSYRENFDLLKEYLTNLHSTLFPESYLLLSKAALFNCVRELTRHLNNGLKYYHTLKTFNEKMEVKPTLIFSQEILTRMTRLLRFEQKNLTNCNQILKDLENMLVDQTILINTRFKKIAEKEIMIFHDKKLKSMLEKSFQSFFKDI